MARQLNRALLYFKKYWEIIADNLEKSGWSWGYVSTLDSRRRTIWITDAHRDNGQRFIVHADDKLTAFVELEAAIRRTAAHTHHNRINFERGSKFWILSSVVGGFRSAFLSEVEHRAEARQWERVIKERLPKSEVFNWRECSLNSDRTIERDARILANWADLILGFGSRSACDRMAGWPEMARWRKEGKAILWLHAAPVDDPMEEVQSPDVEVMRREVWSQI